MQDQPNLDRRSFLAGSALGAVALAAAGPGAAQGPARRGGLLRVSVDQAPAKLSPLQHRVNPEYLLGELLYSGLTRLAPDMSAEPDLARSWSANAALTEWTFALREGVVFHDGSPFTADDVVATFEAILDPANGSPGRSNVGPIGSVTAAGPGRVVFGMKGAYADLPVALAYLNARIVPAPIARGDLGRLDREAVGTGPFRLVAYEPARRVAVARNPDYYAKDRPHLDRVEVVVLPDTTAEATALAQGDTDLMLTVAPSDYKRLNAAYGVTGLRTPSGQFLNIILGCDRKPFSDVRVRRALALAVERDALVEFVAQGYGTPGNDTPINSTYRFHHDLPLRRANHTEAKRLLAEAGYPGGLALTLVASDKPSTRIALAEALRDFARPAGFDITVEAVPHAEYLDRVWRKGAFYVGSYNMHPTANGIFSLLFTSDAAWNEARWNNPAFDRLVQEARGTADETRRRALYAESQRLMHDEVPTVIPVFFDVLAAKRDYVQGYALHPRGAVFRLDHAWLDERAPRRG